MKATGISLYRLVVPIVAIAAILAVSLFLFDQFYLPQANRRQEALRNIIKGTPAADRSASRTELDLRRAASRASPAASSTTSSSIPTATSSPTSPSSNSIPPPSPSRGASSPLAPSGTPTPVLALLERLAARHRRAPTSPSIASFRDLLRRDSRRPRLLQEGKPASAGDELRPARPLHRRPAPERL